MFEYLNRFPTIIVTGPHRSGTTVCSEMIALDTRRTNIREESFGATNFRKFLWLILWTRLAKLRVVIQAPFMFHHLRLFGPLPGTAVVLMRRPLNELREALERCYTIDGLKLSVEEHDKLVLERFGLESGDPAEVIYEFWERWKRYVRHPFEVNYSDLANHPYWVPSQVRRAAEQDWHIRRTS